jgi:hypothetical protein
MYVQITWHEYPWNVNNHNAGKLFMQHFGINLVSLGTSKFYITHDLRNKCLLVRRNEIEFWFQLHKKYRKIGKNKKFTDDLKRLQIVAGYNIVF